MTTATISSTRIPILRMGDLRLLFHPAGPVFAFAFPWLAVIFLHQLAMCGFIQPGISLFTVLILANVFGAIIFGLFIQCFLPFSLQSARQRLKQLKFSNKQIKVISLLTCFYLFVQLFQVVYFKGCPLTWLFTNSSRCYADYGIKSLNGMLNAVFLFSTTAHVLIYQYKPTRKRLLLILFLLTIPILVISRQLLICVFLQAACCLLIFRPWLLKKALLVLTVLLTTFILVGNYRTGLTRLIQLTRPADWVPEPLYPTIWIYNYMVAPYNNMHEVTADIEPLYHPYFELSELLPSVFRNTWIEQNEHLDAVFTIAHPEVSTVNTMYWNLIADFGIFYAFVFVTLIQLWALFSLRRALRTESSLDLIQYAVLYMILFLSIFDNLMLFLPVAFQLILIKGMKVGARIKTRIFF